MPVHQYECLVLFDTSKIAGAQDTAKSQVVSTLEKYGAEIIAARNWDERKLAYPIANQKKGLYYLTYFKADSSKIDPIQGDFRINENILRFMTIKIPDKWEDEMQAVAREEGRFAYQAIREDVETGDPALDGVPLEEGMGGGGRGRRGRGDAPDKD